MALHSIFNLPLKVDGEQHCSSLSLSLEVEVVMVFDVGLNVNNNLRYIDVHRNIETYNDSAVCIQCTQKSYPLRNCSKKIRILQGHVNLLGHFDVDSIFVAVVGYAGVGSFCSCGSDVV